MRRLLISACCAAFILALSLNNGFAAEPAKPAAKGAAPAPAKTGLVKAADTGKAAQQELIDINSASDAELKAIPGLGGASAAKIVANRPYANKAQLVSRKVLPEAVYEKVKERIIARQPKKAGTAAKPEPMKK